MPSSIIVNNIVAQDLVTYVNDSNVSEEIAFKCLDGRLTTASALPVNAEDIFIVLDLGSAKTFDAVGFARHNLASVGCSLIMWASPTESFGSAVYLDTITPEDDNVQFYNVGSKTAQRYLYLIFHGHNSTVYIGDLTIGTRLEWSGGQPVGFVDPVLANDDEVIGNVTRGGFVSGTSYRSKPKKFDIHFQHQSPAWLDENWPTIVDALRRGPFYFRWAEIADGMEADRRPAFCWVQGKIPSPKYTSTLYQSASVKVEGVTE